MRRIDGGVSRVLIWRVGWSVCHDDGTGQLRGADIGGGPMLMAFFGFSVPT